MFDEYWTVGDAVTHCVRSPGLASTAGGAAGAGGEQRLDSLQLVLQPHQPARAAAQVLLQLAVRSETSQLASVSSETSELAVSSKTSQLACELRNGPTRQ